MAEKKVELIKGEIVEPVEDYENKKKKNIFTYIGIGAVAVLIVVIIIVIIIVMNAYKKPVRNLVKGMNRANTEILMEAVYPEDVVTYKHIDAKNNGISWEDYLQNNDNLIKSRLENMYFKKAKCKVLAKEKISGSNFDKIHDFYIDKYDVEINKAYRLEVNMTFRTNSGSETPSGWICVVKIKGEGWKFCSEYSEKHFDFIDEALKFE